MNDKALKAYWAKKKKTNQSIANLNTEFMKSKSEYRGTLGEAIDQQDAINKAKLKRRKK